MHLTGPLEGMKSFEKSTIKMKDPGKVAEMVRKLIADGPSRLQAVEWYTQAHEVLVKTELKKQDLVTMVRDSSAQLREGTDRLLEDLQRLSVPVLIFSAGLGDLIHVLLEQQAKDHDNIKVVSNYMRFDEEGKMIGFTDDLIHMYNKNEHAVHSSAYFERLRGRHNVLLMGDNVGDLRMADGVEEPNVTLRVGFLNHPSEERLAKFLDLFDIVLLDDQTMDLANDIVSRLS